MKKSALSIIFFTVFIDLLGFGILIPILPIFASRQLAISDFAIGILFASFSLVQFLFNPVLGRLSDKYGRRPLILLSLSSTVISYIIFAFAGSFWVLLISRLLAGFGGSNIAVAQAYIADVTPVEQRSRGMGMIGMAFGLGFMLGPMAGGLLSGYGYSVAGLASAAFSFTALFFAFFMLKESLPAKTEISASQASKQKLFDVQSALKTFRNPDQGILILLFFLITFSGANIFGTFALLGNKVYGFNNQQIGLLFTIMGVTSAVVQGGFTKLLTENFKEKTLIAVGTFIMIFGLALLPYGGNFLGLAIIISVQAVGTGILQPVVLSMVSKYTAQNEQGEVLGLNQSMSALARVLGPLWGGFAFEFIGYEFPFLTGAAFMAICFLFSLWLLRSHRFVKSQFESLDKDSLDKHSISI